MTNSFLNLLKGTRDFGKVEPQRYAEAQFPSLVESSHMYMWRIGDAWPPAGEQVIWIGVATWSLYDMELLDVLEAKLSRETVNEKIYVFDIAGHPEFSFEEHLPGIDKVFHTPVVGSWDHGVLEQRLSGARARDWLIDRYGLTEYRGSYNFGMA
jgi:hypothetical protein